jgi:hypothetical protein
MKDKQRLLWSWWVDGDLVIELLSGSDESDQHLLRVRFERLAQDAEIEPGTMVVYRDEARSLAQAAIDAAVDIAGRWDYSVTRSRGSGEGEG